MKSRKIAILTIAALTISACSGQKEKARQSKTTSLIESVEELHVDTIVTAPGETLCNAEIDHVLRHYPELYRATKQAKKMYAKLTEQNIEFVKDGAYDVTPLLDKALFGQSATAETSEWPDFSDVDSIYLRRIADAETTEAKTEIGRTRRAWTEYMKQLESIANALPEECRPRFIEAIQ